MSVLLTIAALCQLGGGSYYRTEKCQKYYVNCYEAKMAASKALMYKPTPDVDDILTLSQCIKGVDL